MAYVVGHSIGSRIVEALGLAGRPIRRVVIDVPCEGVVTYYVEELADRDRLDLDALTAALRDAGAEQTADEPVIVVSPPTGG